MHVALYPIIFQQPFWVVKERQTEHVRWICDKAFQPPGTSNYERKRAITTTKGPPDMTIQKETAVNVPCHSNLKMARDICHPRGRCGEASILDAALRIIDSFVAPS
jgi:hypothetical protein